MKFYEAMRVLFEDEETIRRKSWNNNECLFVNVHMKTIFKNTTDKYERYAPTMHDMFADDWEIVK